MRILHVTDTYLPRLGGIEIHVDDLVRRQRAQGHDARILTCSPTSDSLTGRHSSDPPWVRRISSHALTGPGRSLAAARDVSALTVGSDIVHAHASVVSPLAMAAARSARVGRRPTVVTVHSLWSRLGPLPVAVEATLRMRTWPVVWSGVSTVAAEAVSRTLGGVPVSSVPHGVDHELWRPSGTPPTGELTIVSVMRLARRKRPLPFLRMLRRLRQLAPTDLAFRVLIIGEGPEREAMQRYLRIHRMEAWVTVLGRLERSQIRQVFSQSHVFVAPAELESFGIAALEARSAGLPVVASARGGVGEFVQDGLEGLLSWTDRAMVDAMLTFLTQAPYRRQVTTYNRAVPPRTTWDAALEATEDLYWRARYVAAGGPVLQEVVV